LPVPQMELTPRPGSLRGIGDSVEILRS
jgi:hypothetical protein